ncbi:MAG: hypothetical protein GX023_07180 [Tissierellia bacterium]|nr:hypothetical protein [Tissierellia bacterium]
MFYKEKMVIIKDIVGNLNLFRIKEQEIVQHIFNKLENSTCECVVSKGVYVDFNATIDNENQIYIIYQDMSFNLILLLLKEEQIENIKLTSEPIPEVYNIDIMVKDRELHIFYCISLLEEGKKYRIYHHHYDGNNWDTHIVDEIKVGEVLNPMDIISYDEKLIMVYHGRQEDSIIYMKSFDLTNKKWENRIKLTRDSSRLLYLDTLLIENKLHIVYCQYDDNLRVKYERFDIGDKIVKDIDEILSNDENIMYPTIIYYDDKLWVVWLEYENIISRYSKDNGTTWSPIYSWENLKHKEIVRFKYIDKFNEEGNFLDYSFGTIRPKIEFIGFGSVKNTVEIPLKKKNFHPIFRF